MRILQIGKFPETVSGGIESAVFGLGRCLARRAEVTVVTTGLSGKRTEHAFDGISCVHLPAVCTVASTPISPALIRYLWRKEGFDIVQISLPNPMAAIAYLLARPRGKLVIWYHSDIVRQRILGMLLRPFLRLLLKKASAIVVSSEAYKVTSVDLRNFLEKTVVIPYGIDITTLPASSPAACGKPKDRPSILYIGRLVPYKGVRYLIKAMKDIDGDLLIIGDGPLKGSLKRYALSLGIANRIIFKSVPRGESLTPYIIACDMLILPSISRAEAFGLVLIEAMLHAKPVIATELGTGTSYVCRDGINGITVKPMDPDALEGAIKNLSADQGRAKRLGEAGRLRVEKEFNSERMASDFMGLYGSIVYE